MVILVGAGILLVCACSTLLCAIGFLTAGKRKRSVLVPHTDATELRQSLLEGDINYIATREWILEGGDRKGREGWG